MKDFLQEFLDFIFVKKEIKPPEGVQQMHQAIVELRESTEDLKQKLDEHRHEYVVIGGEPIREHVVPQEYTRRR